MKIKKNNLKIEDVFEIKIDLDIWQQIKNYADKHSVSYSWITRLCAFRLVKKLNEHNPIFSKANEKVRKSCKKSISSQHRHQMCLYGEDAIQIRIYAAKFGLTITQFVRVALFLYLKYFQKNLKEWTLIYYGTKITLLFVTKNRNNLNTVLYKKQDYWPIKRFSRFMT